jgi:aldose 1-epimerase
MADCLSRKLKKHPQMKYGKTYCCKNENGEDIYLFALRNDKGTEVLISNYGAIITSFKIKNSTGDFTDIVLGFEKMDDYFDANYRKQYPYFGAAIGRYANRIKNAEIEIDGEKFLLSKNNGSSQLHGGFQGFDSKVWEVLSFDDERQSKLEFKYISKDGEEGFPGNLEVVIHFELTEDNELIYEYTATTDKPTAVNCTHHSYFNLNNGEGNMLDHVLTINANKILEQDESLTTNGKILHVKNTKFDFKKPVAIADKIDKATGFDQSFVIDKTVDGLNLAATVYSPKTKFQLEVFTTEPVVHFYTGQGIPKIIGKHKILYGPYSGLCLETQVHPNAINVPSFPSTILRPGETYHQKTVYKVSLPEKK